MGEPEGGGNDRGSGSFRPSFQLLAPRDNGRLRIVPRPIYERKCWSTTIRVHDGAHRHLECYPHETAWIGTSLPASVLRNESPFRSTGYTMPRPKTANLTTAELDAQIAELQRQRTEIETIEDRRRGQLVREYLAGPHADTVRRTFDSLAAPKDRPLFGLSEK